MTRPNIGARHIKGVQRQAGRTHQRATHGVDRHTMGLHTGGMDAKGGCTNSGEGTDIPRTCNKGTDRQTDICIAPLYIDIHIIY